MGSASRCAATADRRECESFDGTSVGGHPPLKNGSTSIMKRFIIEREVPGASELTEEQLSEISKTSNAAVASLGVPYNWVTSYVAGDKLYCVHEADDAEAVLEHARRGGFPANKVTVVANEFGPQSADLVAS
jgi:hypothetical protein